jgi:hypothetical protein
MKRMIFLAVAIFATATLSAQSGIGRDVNYYGVDFSGTKVFGATEPGSELKEAFREINSLVIGEWKKYNPGEFLGKNIVIRDITPTGRVNQEIDPAEVEATSSDWSLSKDDIAAMVRRYAIKENSGTGLVIIPELLDKSTYTGGFIVVYFDVATREVLHGEGISGKARGFGLRNYWAGALYSALRGR